MPGDDSDLPTWRRHFDATFYIGHPCLPPISTMQEVEDNLVAAINAVESFGEDDQVG